MTRGYSIFEHQKCKLSLLWRLHRLLPEDMKTAHSACDLLIITPSQHIYSHLIKQIAKSTIAATKETNQNLAPPPIPHESRLQMHSHEPTYI